MDGITVVSSLLKVGAVLVLLVLSLRLLARHQAGRSGLRSGQRARPAALIEVLEQSRLSRTATVAAVRVGDRVLLLGTTEASVETLADVTDDIDLTVEEDDDPGSDQSVLHHALDLLRSGNLQP